MFACSFSSLTLIFRNFKVSNIYFRIVISIFFSFLINLSFLSYDFPLKLIKDCIKKKFFVLFSKL